MSKIKEELPRLLRKPEVLHLVGLSGSHINKMIAQGKFPHPVQIGERAVAWPEKVIKEWIESRLTATYVPKPNASAGRPRKAGLANYYQNQKRPILENLEVEYAEK